ncbi:MAG: dihydroneopterin aldolase [Synechococcus sp. SP2 MAG]|nr:dihydroneopterin aldolase [Synechococcus sp. SP2 MAG]
MDLIHIHDLHLWAHVGVLEHERRDGQWFQLDITLGLDLSESAKSDDLRATADYSRAVLALQALVRELSCLTIERFSEEVFEVLEGLYGPLPMHLLLQKCHPPIAGFTGTVSIERRRHWSAQQSF